MASIWANTIFVITIIGTDNSIPIGPQRVPQNMSEISITRGLKLSLFPISRGSIRFQISTCVTTIRSKNIVVAYIDSNCTKENSTGKDTAIIDPTFGI